MKRMMIAFAMLLLFHSVSYAEEYDTEFIHSWPCAFESIRSINGTVYLTGRTELLGTINIYTLKRGTPSLFKRCGDVISIGEYNNKLFLWEHDGNPIEILFKVGGKDCLYSIGSDKKKEKLIEYRMTKDDLLTGITARNNHIYTMIKNKKNENYSFYITDMNNEKNMLLYVSEKPMKMYYQTFCLLERKKFEIYNLCGESSDYSRDCVFFDYSTLSIISLPSEITIKNYNTNIQAVLINNQLYYLSFDGVHVFDFEKMEDQVLLSLPGHDYYKFSLSKDKIILYVANDNSHYSADIYSLYGDDSIITVPFSNMPYHMLITSNYIYSLEGNCLECINIHDKTSIYYNLGD